jgi:Flp pilus assembly protein TadG
MKKTCRKENGSVLITMALAAGALFGASGMAVDLGRMFIARNELQSIADATAVAAALRLNGEDAGVTRAKAEVEALRQRNLWHLGTTQVPAGNVTIEFGRWNPLTSQPEAWAPTPGSAAQYAFTRVRVRAEVPVYFMAALTGGTSSPVSASAIAGQLVTNNPQGLFPFTPMAHDSAGPDFGLAKGVEYTLKWASAPKLVGGNPNVCAGDREQKWLDLAESRGADNRGYYGSQDASEIRDQIGNDAPVRAYSIGDYIELSGGAKSTVKDILVERILQDRDHDTETFNEYRDRGHSRRLITVPISDPTSVPQNRVLGYGRFFLKKLNFYQTAQGNDEWCAEYVGPAAPEGGDSKGAGVWGGITKVRLWN